MQFDMVIQIKGFEIPCTVEADISTYNYSGDYGRCAMADIENISVYAGKQSRDITKFIPKEERDRIETKIMESSLCG